ncbi:translation initiation factor IF-3, partial [Candidatus Poribacteria bacterium]|nr:translation initiation factor IF-3 [Candidatus Poribacteria bacterium]
MQNRGSRVQKRVRQQQNRVNERIRVRQVFVVDSDNKQLGVMYTREALERAREEGLDLVEVSPNAEPPVCKIMDYGKFQYEKSKRAKEAKK